MLIRVTAGYTAAGSDPSLAGLSYRSTGSGIVVGAAMSGALDQRIAQLARYGACPPLRGTHVSTGTGVGDTLTEVNEGLGRLTAELEEMKELEADWDSDGAHRITNRAVDTASQVLRIVNTVLRPVIGDDALPSAVSPLPTGGVGLEWTRSNSYVSVFVGPKGDLGFLHKTVENGKAAYHEEHVSSVDELVVLIARALFSRR
jgi:hypothetical protein